MSAEGTDGQTAKSFVRTRQFRVWMLVLTGLALLVAAALLRSVTTPILISLVIAYILDPLVLWLERRKLRRSVAVVAVYVAFIGVIAVVLITVLPPVYRQVSKLPGYVERVASRAQAPAQVLPDGEPLPEPADEPAAPAEGAVAEEPAGPAPSTGLIQTAVKAARPHLDKIAVKALSFFRTVVERVAASIGEVIGTLIQLVLVFIYTFFFLLGLHPFFERVRAYLPGRYRGEIVRVLGRLDSAYSNFFRGRVIVALSSGVLTSVGLWIVGIPFWLLIGMTVGALGIIPFVGVLLGLIPAVILGFLTGGWGTVIGVLIVFAIAQLIEPILTPLVLSRGLKLHPVTILIGLLVGGKLFGMFGAVISVPLVSTVKILSEEFLLPPLKELAEEGPAQTEG